MTRCCASSGRRSRPGRARGCGSGEALASISANASMEPAKLTRLVRGELDWIVMKTLEKDRNRRYETANGLAADVQRYLHDEPVRGVSAVGLVSVPQVRAAAQAGVLDRVGGGPGGGADSGGQRRADLAGQPGTAKGPRPQSAGAYFERIALAEREWAANNLSRMEATARAVPAEDCAAGNGDYLKRLRYGATFPPAPRERPCIASRSAPTASTWPRPRRKALSDSGRQRPARNSGNGRLTTENATCRLVQPRRPVSRHGRLGCDGQGLGRGEGPSGGGQRAAACSSNTPAESGCGV